MNPDLKTLQNALYLWLYLTNNYLNYAINVGDTSPGNVTANINNATALLQAANAKLTINAGDIKYLMSILLDQATFPRLVGVAGLLARVPSVSAGWGGDPRHPVSAELDSVIFP